MKWRMEAWVVIFIGGILVLIVTVRAMLEQNIFITWVGLIAVQCAIVYLVSVDNYKSKFGIKRELHAYRITDFETKQEYVLGDECGDQLLANYYKLSYENDRAADGYLSGVTAYYEFITASALAIHTT